MFIKTDVHAFGVSLITYDIAGIATNAMVSQAFLSGENVGSQVGPTHE